jgi:hypothetical protein
VVERSLAWLVGCRRLQVRYERHTDILLVCVLGVCADLPQLAEPAEGRTAAVACVKAER